MQAFLKKCKVLSADEIDEDMNCDEEDFDDDEMRDAEAQARDPIIRQEIKEAADGFEKTMLKLREIGKIILLHVAHKSKLSIVK